MNNPFRELEQGADHIDSKTFVGNRTLREFLAAMINYKPGWLTVLYRVRSAVARLFGLQHADIERSGGLKPESVGFAQGDPVGFFVTVLGRDDEYWAGMAEDRHLAGYVCVRAEPAGDGLTRFHVGTIVHYRHWTGPVYFNLIRPFHHLIVRAMGNAAARG